LFYSRTPWTELKSTAVASSSTTKYNPAHAELTKSEREAKCLFSTTRTQDALSKWIQTQFKDNLQAIDGRQDYLQIFFLVLNIFIFKFQHLFNY
jgi:hypothetical protein